MHPLEYIESFSSNSSVLTYASSKLLHCSIFNVSVCDAQGVVSCLEEQFSPKVQAEFSVLVDVLHSPELLFPEDVRSRFEGGAFMSK